VIGVVSAVRNIRSESRVPPSVEVAVTIKPTAAEAALITGAAPLIGALGRCTVTVSTEATRPPHAAFAAVDSLEVFVNLAGEVDSTQTVARELADTRAPEGTVVTAEHQRAGRGRGGRSWLDRPGENLLLSVILRPAIQAAEVPQLTLVAAVAVAEAVEEVAGLRPDIKWPNDLVLDERKFAGVLTEAASDGRAVSRVIVGIGINVNQREFPI